MNKRKFVFLMNILFLISACQKQQSSIEPKQKASGLTKVKIQQITIAFSGSTPAKQYRSLEEAEKISEEVFEKAKADNNFSELIKKYSDRKQTSSMTISNFKQNLSTESFPREQLESRLGDVSFSLQVGEVALAKFDAQLLKSGFYIIKRVE